MRIPLKQITPHFISSLQEICKNKKEVYVWLAWGSSLDKWYPAFLKYIDSLATDQEKNLIKRIHWCMVDERIVEPDSISSNFSALQTKILKPLKARKLILDTHMHSIDYLNRSPERHYSHRVPRIDIGFYGSWEDGHIASLFPHHTLLESRANKYLAINDSPKPPSDRITVGPEMIRRSKVAFIFFIGDSKQQAFKNFKDENQDEFDCPAKLILESEKHYIITQ